MTDPVASPGTTAPPIDGAAEVASSASPAPPPARSIGERLRAGRERSGLSIPAAAEKLHLDPKIIEALEADRFAEVGASVYVRGHLKRYADFVGEPGGELVEMYRTRETRAAAPDLTQVPQPERRADPRRLVTPMVTLGCGVVLLGAIWWVLGGSRGGPPTPARAESSPVVAGDESPVEVPALPATPVALNTTTSLSTGGLPQSPVTAGEATQDAAPSAVAQPAPAPVKEAVVRDVRLRLELTRDSWVEVYDSRGARLFYDVASAGSVQSVEGRPPLRVVLGNSSGVAVLVDDQPRDIPAGAADGEGARFVVNRSGSLSRAR